MRLVRLYVMFLILNNLGASAEIQKLSIFESPKKVQEEIAAGYDVNARYAYNVTPLIDATMFGKTEIVKILIDAGAEIDLVDNSGSTALHESAIMGELAIAKILIEAGAAIDKKNQYNATPLHAATTKGHIDVSEYLIKKGADVNARDFRGESVLHRVRNWNQYIPHRKKIEKLLIKHGAVDVSP